jgi:hypothetical protein
MPYFRSSRYNDTLTVVRNYGGGIALPLPIRNDIVTMINAQFPRLTVVQRTAFNQLVDNISVKGHIGVGVASGTKIQRQQRRAIALLWAAIGSRGAAGLLPQQTAAMTMAAGNLPAALDEAMFFAAAVASPAGIAHVFNNHFAANPLTFIQQHRMLIQGSTQGQNLLTAPAPGYQNVLAFRFYYVPASQRFQLSVAAPAGIPGHQFNAVSVPALHWAQVPGRGAVASPPVVAVPPPAPPSFAAMQGIEFAGSNWMVTTQLTGCSFCLAEQGGVTYASHITPAPGLNGLALANQLMGLVPGVGGAVMSNHPNPALAPVGVFGPGAGNLPVAFGGNAFYPAVGTYQSMSIFGQNVGGWRIYAQVVLPGGAISMAETRRLI